MLKHTIKSFMVAAAATAALLFLPAGTLYYWQAWAFLPLFLVPMALTAAYLFKHSPELLKKRLDVKEKKFIQAVLAKLFYATVGSILVISGFDRRFGWSSVSLSVVIVSEILFLAGYFFLFLVFKENKYLAHTVVVTEDQKVVTTGPYAVVRHPMYLSELIMFVFAGPALGSYWAVAANLILIVILAVRILTEEDLLLRELKGYLEYTKKTRYRLIPFIW
jgi:protein-S-isoprenylcysteine O-methyltransferase Ste14